MARMLLTLLRQALHPPLDPTDPFAELNRQRLQLGIAMGATMFVILVIALIEGGAG